MRPSDSFIGRRWVLDHVGHWATLIEPSLLITGAPGSGKTAIIQKIAGETQQTAGTLISAVHYCRAAERTSCDPVRIVESIAQQFCVSIEGFTQALLYVSTEQAGLPHQITIQGSATVGLAQPGTHVSGVSITILNAGAEEAVDRLLRRPLERLALPTLPVIAIDAVDEAATYQGRPTIAELVLNPEYEFPVRTLVTSRPDRRIIRLSSPGNPGSRLDLVDDSPADAADMLQYADHRLSNILPVPAERTTLAQRVAEEGGDNYLYIYHLTGDLQTGRRTLQEIDTQPLPASLSDLYRQFIRRELRPDGGAADTFWRERIRPVLAVLTAALEGGFTTSQIADILDRNQVEIQDVLDMLGQYLTGLDSREGPWIMYHRSFAEFLVSESEGLLDPADGHTRIADFALEFGGEDWSRIDSYCLRNVGYHLSLALNESLPARSAKNYSDRLFALARSEDFLRAQAAIAPERDLHLATIHLALEQALKGNQYLRAVQLGIDRTVKQAESDAVSPVDAALQWGYESGCGRARTYAKDVAVVWYLLIALSMARQGRADPFHSTLEDLGSHFEDRVSSRWSIASAIGTSLLVPLMRPDEVRRILRISDDTMLGFTASFMLESDNPEWAVVPCLWIEDSVKRARAAIEIMDRLTYLGHPLEALQSIASAVINGYEDRQASMDRLLSGFREEQDDSSNSSHLKTYLLSPDVPEAILLADAICGRLAEVRDAYLGKSDESFQIESFRATASGYTNALAVGAVLYPEEFEQDLFEHAAEEQLSNVGNKLWSALHFANFLWRSGREQDATELLTKIVEQSSLIYESSDWEMYRGHVDAFHGTCDVGFTHAAVRALCIQMRATEALELVRRVSDTLAPEESMRALATISASNEDPTVERALKDLLTEVKEAAGSTSVDALHTLVDGDLDVYARTMSAALRRATSDRAIEALGSLSLLSWAAENRGDRPASEQLAVEVRQRFDGLSDDARRNVPTGRLVGNLLRARRSSAAVELMQLSHWRAGSSTETSGPPKDWPHWIANEVIDSLSVDGRIVELVGFLDLHPDVWRNELLRDLARSVLHESKLSPSLMERLADLDLSCHQFAGIVRIIRCGSDTDAARRLTDFARSAIRAGVKRAFKQVRSDGRRREAGEYYGGHRDFSSRIKDAEELALASAEVGMARQCERSLGLLGHFEYEQEMQSMGWDAFRGHLPSSDEISWESDREALKRCELNSRLASAFHRASCFQASRRYLSKATDGLSTIRTNELYARALEPLAVATVRCEDFHLMQSLLLQPMRATGTRVGVVVQLLVEHVLSVGHTSQASKEALNKLLAADNLANWDYLDAFGSIAVMAASDGDGIQRVILEALTSATAAR